MNAVQYSNEAADDGDYFIQYGSKYVIQEYKKVWTKNTDVIQILWNGRSTESTGLSTFLLQIYNVNSATWETLASETRVPADTDFTLTGSQQANVSNYYDSSFVVTIRVYQQVL